MSHTLLELRDVTVELGNKTILRNLNFQIYKGESLVIIGPSGGGKTVLLKTLAGVYAPTQGKVLIEGESWQDVTSEHKHDLAKKLGMLFQMSALFDTATALENVEFPIKEHFELPDDAIRKQAIDLLTRVNLGAHLNKKPSELSGGMKRRLGLARALALNPEIIFYDDPVAGQDPVQTDQMLNLISEFKQKDNSTLVMVTCSMYVARRMADRVIMVVDGEIVEIGSPAEMDKHPDPRVQQFINGEQEGPIKVF